MKEKKKENKMNKQNQETLALQAKTDEFYQEAQKELEDKKKSRDFFFVILSMPSIAFLVSLSDSSAKENIQAFCILASLCLLNSVLYQKSKADIECQFLYSIKNEEKATKEYKENELRVKEGFKLRNEARKIEAKNMLGLLIALGGLLTITAGAISEKTTYPTSIIAGLLICSATSYWAKHNVEYINNKYKANLNKIVQLKSLEKE